MLNYFLTVVREGSMNKAAEILHITQPTLSRQIAQLEEELGVKLFARKGRGLSLTNEGMLLRRRAEEIVSLVDRTEKDLLEQEELLEGKLVIGGGELSAIFDLAGMIEGFHEAYPRVRYDLITASANDTIEQIEKGLADIGVLLEPVDVEKFDFIRLKEKEEWGVIMRADDPLSKKEKVGPEDLKDFPLILPRRKNVHNEVESWFGPHYKDLDILFTSNLKTNGAIMAHRGLARSIIVEGSVRLWDPKEIVFRPLFPEMTSGCVLVWKKNQPMNTLTSRFIEFARSYMENQRDEIIKENRTGK